MTQAQRIYSTTRGYGTVVRVVTSEDQRHSGTRRPSGPKFRVKWDNGGTSVVRASACAALSPKHPRFNT
jgi:hypothetical protein